MSAAFTAERPGRGRERGAGVRERLAAEGLDAAPWENGPGTRYASHDHPYDKVLAVESGSITFSLAGGGDVALEAGDRLDLPAATLHGALVGPGGVVCLEAHLPAGTLERRPRSRGADW